MFRKTKRMKRLLLVLVAIFALSGAFAQKEVPLSYVLNPQTEIAFPVYLRGPASTCQPVKLELKAAYQPEYDMITVKIRPEYEKPMLKKEQYTHLWFPMSWGATQYNQLKFDEHFRSNYRSKVSLGGAIKDQITVNQTTDTLKPAFQCLHGEFVNQKDLDVMLSLKENKTIVLKIKAQDNKQPVVLKINNVIPLRARFNFPMIFNKAFLQYISNSYTITLRLPEGGCYGLNETISQYKKWNDELKVDYQNLLDYLINNGTSQAERNAALRKRLEILSKYEPARKGITEVECEELLREYATFHEYYNKVAKGVISGDSIQKMIAQMDELIDNISIAKNKGDGKTCLKYKTEAQKFNEVGIDASVYEEFPDMKKLAKLFTSRLETLNTITCPNSGRKVVTGDGGGGGGCNIDVEKIKAATREINELLNKYRVSKNKNEQKYYSIVKETDAYLKTFSDACKKNKKYKTIIHQYQDAKQTYQNAVK